MAYNDLKRINDAILNKKHAIITNESAINELQDFISNSKVFRIYKDGNSILKPQMKNDMAKIKKLHTKLIHYRKELKIYEAEYEKKRNDLNYHIDFVLLRKKYNKYNTQL